MNLCRGHCAVCVYCRTRRTVRRINGRITMPLELLRRTLTIIAAAFCMTNLLVSPPAQAADTEVPTADLAGLADPPGLKRYTGSVLIYRDDVAYDEIEFPAGKALRAEGIALKNSKGLSSSGKRALAMYITPAGRSSLEVIRSYQQHLRAEGFEPVFECVDASCGEGYGAIMPSHGSSFTNFYVAKDFTTKVTHFSPAGCAGATSSAIFAMRCCNALPTSKSSQSRRTARVTWGFTAIKKSSRHDPACSLCACSPPRVNKIWSPLAPKK